MAKAWSSKKKIGPGKPGWHPSFKRNGVEVRGLIKRAQQRR